MAKKRTTCADTWNPNDAAMLTNYSTDSEIERKEDALRAMYRARAGRPINHHGWCWCASCGAEKVTACMDVPDEAKLVDGRATIVCSRCDPHETCGALDSMATWVALPEPKAKWAEWAAAAFHWPNGRLPPPEAAMRRAARARLASAVADARGVASGEPFHYFTSWDAAVIRIAGTAEENSVADAALAKKACAV